jgi:hypothetical protein
MQGMCCEASLLHGKGASTACLHYDNPRINPRGYESCQVQWNFDMKHPWSVMVAKPPTCQLLRCCLLPLLLLLLPSPHLLTAGPCPGSASPAPSLQQGEKQQLHYFSLRPEAWCCFTSAQAAANTKQQLLTLCLLHTEACCNFISTQPAATTKADRVYVYSWLSS